MTKTRSDYKSNRNLQIFQDYQTTDVTYEKLAKKYNLTRQRIMAIVKDMQEKGLGRTLDANSAKAEREKFKDFAVKTREHGHIDEAIRMFNDVIAWDQKNENIKGLMDVLGHKKISLEIKASKTKGSPEKAEILREAERCITEAIELGKKHKYESKDLATQFVHLGILKFNYSKLLKGTKKDAEIKESIKILEKGIKNLGGTQAHRAWPMKTLGLAYYENGNLHKALEVLTQAELNLIEGYKDEIKHATDARIKILVWLAGIKLAIAEVSANENMNILAEAYAKAVIAISDPDNILVHRKKEAKEILDKLRI